MPRSPTRFLIVLGLALFSAVLPASAQQTSQEELDRLLAPIALYPDTLVAQILMASTYPLEVVYAARWTKEHPELKGKALEDALQKQDWAAEVKALTAVPQVLKHMNDNLGWMHKLGDAVLADQKAVLETVQTLRTKAQAAGNLKSTPEQTVRTEVQESKSVIIIEPAKKDVVYVPTYDPSYVYGSWWYSYPPYSMYPPGYYYPPGLAFASGVFWGAVIAGGITWGGGGNWNINVGGGGGNWGHHVDHRRGVAYGDNRAAQKYNRGGDRAAVQSREQFRARADSGRSQLQNMDRSQLQNRAGASNRAAGVGDRASGGSRDLGAGRTGASAGTRDSSSRGSSGFSGAGSGVGSSTRQASTRGSSSRGSMGGGSRGGGGGRGGGGRR